MPPRVFNIEAGVPFLETFVEALFSGLVIPGFDRHSDPIELARFKIYVPTRRAAQALASELARQCNGSVLLPSIIPLGALGDEDDGVDPFDNPLDSSLPPAVGDFERRIALGELILDWSSRLKGAIVSIGPDGKIEHEPETVLVGTHPVDAWRLSGELAKLIDEMVIEDIPWERLNELNGEFDEYWRITLNFLAIAVEAWPKILEEKGLVDLAFRQRATIAQAVKTLQHANHPVIALGSTGSQTATAQLLAAIARLDRGAVILPGLDRNLDAESFAALQEQIAVPTHAQSVLARLIKKIGIDRDNILSLGSTSDKAALRQAFISESLRPTETTDLWWKWRSARSEDDMLSALEDVTLIETANEREEALAIALCLRESLENPGSTAALITPDRGLAKRVRAELLRWNIEIDDSGGVSLGATQAGTLARLLLKASFGSATDCAALLAHPLSVFGRADEAGRLSRLFEIGVLRSSGAQFGVWSDAVATARQASLQRDAHPSHKLIGDADWDSLDRYAVKLDAALAPLRALDGECELQRWIAAHRAAIGLVCCDDTSGAAPGNDGEALAMLFDELAGAATPRWRLNLKTYTEFFDAVISERVARGPQPARPRLQILGLLEARLINVQRVVLADLNETIWPPQATSDSFLNRPMREELGLTSPDMRIGQTAHDFCQALGNPEIIWSRAKKRDGAPTIASRFLQRMEALAGEKVFNELRRRGAYWIDLAQHLDSSAAAPPLRRPSPRPSLELRPPSLSVTRIETLRRDPYSIYARFILKLQKLPQLDEKVGPREIGIALHHCLEQFCRDHPIGPLPADARSTLHEMARLQLKEFEADPAFLAFRWPQIEKGIDVYLAFETERRSDLHRLLVEENGALAMTLNDGSEFMLTCKADRIEVLRDGDIALGDYKTGEIPSYAQISAGFSPQLTLEAAMIERGAFKKVAAGPVASAYYIPLSGSAKSAVEIKPPKKEARTFRELSQEHFDELVELLSSFRDSGQGYPARPFPQFASRYNDYDHLARTREWSIAGDTSGGEE